MYTGFHIKYRLFLSDFNETWILPTYFVKILKCQISWKSIQWQPSFSLRTDEQTDMTKLIVTSRNSAKAPQNSNTTGRRNSKTVFGILLISTLKAEYNPTSKEYSKQKKCSNIQSSPKAADSETENFFYGTSLKNLLRQYSRLLWMGTRTSKLRSRAQPPFYFHVNSLRP